MTQDQEKPFDNFVIYLSLSGGGLRATLFHLGVLRFLKQCGYIDKVSHICSVSGGSITAGHVLQNWDQYAKGDDKQFLAAANKLISGAARYGIRQHIAYSLLKPQRRFGQLHRCYVDGLARDKSDCELKSILQAPAFHILGTDFSTGQLVAFSREGIAMLGANEQGELREERPAQNSKDAEFGLWKAVACSSAFPPMFPPHLISPEEYASGSGKNITVGDGGVYDNLGIALTDHVSRGDHEQNILYIVSDAGLPFRNGLVSDSTYRQALDRLTRASDIQFYRLADSDVRQFTRQCAGNSTRRLLSIRIGDLVEPAGDESVLDVEVQKLVGNVRTDLDTFCDEEIHGVIQHGWELIRNKWQQKTGLNATSSKTLDWIPAGKAITQDEIQKRLKDSSSRRFYWRPLLHSYDILWLLPTVLVVGGLLALGLATAFGFHVIDHVRYKKLANIEAGQIGVLSSWAYSLDKEEAIIEVQHSKKPELVGQQYVIVVMKHPVDDTPLLQETKTVTSKLQMFPPIGAPIVKLHIPCPRLAGTVQYGDAVGFYLYVIPKKNIPAIQHAIDIQAEQPLTLGRIVNEFGGIKMGGGMDGAAFDENGEIIRSALQSLENKRNADKQATPK